ncbi:MAG: DUF2939 domain-containing protein [Caulobacteraceae bacterium]|nr:DUF2939 domain-containing protein [Caulobacteraceae bacterium]
MGNALSKIVGAVIGLVIIWFGFAPYYAFFALRSAAQSSDAAALADLVDYPKVKAALREQIDPGHPAGPPPNVWEDPIGALRRSLEPMQPSPTADVYLTPQALAALTMGDGRDARRTPSPAEDPGEHRVLARPYPAYSYWGPNLARLTVTDDEQGETTFTFTRKGVSWKLSHIGLPPANDGTVVPRPAPGSPAGR